MSQVNIAHRTDDTISKTRPGKCAMGNVVAEHITDNDQIIRLVHGDLTEEHVDAIVNAANTQLVHGGGVAGAIVRRCGVEIQVESTQWVKEYGPVSSGGAAITTAGKLPCEHVIHVVGPVWGEGDEDRKLETAVQTALKAADQLDLAKISLPAISTGIFGFPKGRGADVILEAINQYVKSHGATSLREISITLIDVPTMDVFQESFKKHWGDQ